MSLIPTRYSLDEIKNASTGGKHLAGPLLQALVTHVMNASSHLGAFNLADLPDATAYINGETVHVSDESGGAVNAFSDGTDWRRCTDRAIVT